MSYDNNIAQTSQTWANYLLANNLFQHSGSSLYGENLAYFRNYKLDMLSIIKLSIDMWYNEVSLYDFNAATFTEASGHFTCLVWKSSVKVGIGYSYDSNTDTAIVIMNTSPPGNVYGQFKTNVLPLISNPTPITPVVINPTPPQPIVVPAPTTVPVVTNCPDNTNNMLMLYSILNDVNNNVSKYNLILKIKKLIKTMAISS